MHNFKSLIQLLFAHMKAGEILIGVIVTSFFMNVLALVFPLVILQFYDRIIPNQAYNTLKTLMFIIVLVVVFETFLKILRASVVHWSSARFEHRESCETFNGILHAPSIEHHRLAAGEYLDRISSFFAMKDFYGGQAVSLLIDLPFIVIYLVLIAYINGSMLLITLMMLGLLFLAANYFGSALHAKIIQRKKCDDKRYNFIIETLQGIQTIKVNALEAFMNRRYERLQTSAALNDFVTTRLSLNSMFISFNLMQITTVLLIGLGGTYVISGTMTIGELAACTLLANRAMVPLSAAMMYWKRIQSILVTQDRKAEITDKSTAKKNEIRYCKPKISGSIRLENIHFSYKGHSPLFIDLNLDVPAKSCIAIKGHGSSGKTNLLKLIAGIIKPQTGTVWLDGVDVNTIEPEYLHQNIAYLPQNSRLFPGTIMENLTLFDKRNAQKALSFVRAMGLDDVINRLPERYETLVGDSVLDEMHSGTKQQIVVVQNLLKKPKIVLFDESNSALDYEADQKFIALLTWLKQRLTVFIISHRPSMVKVADTVYDLKEGKLVLVKSEHRS